MARRASFIAQERESSDGILLVLDAGSTLFGDTLAFSSEGRVMVAGMNAMAYDAMVVGKMDAAGGLDLLRARADEAEFPILSANLVDAASGEPLFDPYVIIEKQDVRIGILGISDEDVVAMSDVAEQALLLDPIKTAQQYVQGLRAECDLVIVLSRLGVERDQELAQAAPGINVIVGGKTRQLMREPLRVDNTLIVQQGYDGERIGRLSATFGGNGVPRDAMEEIITLGSEYGTSFEMELMLKEYRKRYATPVPTSTPEN